MRRRCIVSYGKARAPWVRDEIEKYRKRLPGLEWVELKESRRDGAEARMREEMDIFQQRFPPPWRAVVLSEEGRTFTTLQWSAWMDAQGSQDLAFIVGSALGIHPQLKGRADLLFSLSPLTFAHEHALVLLAEQIYRCHTVSIGHPYHHA